MNRMIAQWFRDGKFHEAFSGTGEFFVEDHTYRGYHDLILVMSTLLRWAFETEKVDFCTKGFVSALTRIIKENPVHALDIINSYLIVSASTKLKLPINFKSLFPLIESELKSDRSFSNFERNQIKSLTKALSKKMRIFNRLAPKPKSGKKKEKEKKVSGLNGLLPK